MNVGQALLIVVSVVILLDGINLIANTSKTLIEFSMNISAFCNSGTRRAIARNHNKTTKILGIQRIIFGVAMLLISININNTELTTGSTWQYIMLVIIGFNLFISAVIVPSIK